MFVSPHTSLLPFVNFGVTHIVDVEASALDGGFPIEVGVAFLDAAQGRIRHEAKLIRYEPWLQDGRWCALAQSVHGITKEEIRENGQPPEKVCEWMNDRIGAKNIALVGDFRDTRWLSHVFDVAGRGMVFHLDYIGKMLDAARISQDTYLRFLEKTAHRAGNDAMQMYKAFMQSFGIKFD